MFSKPENVIQNHEKLKKKQSADRKLFKFIQLTFQAFDIGLKTYLFIFS